MIVLFVLALSWLAAVTVAHEAWLAIAYCVAIMVVSFTAASWLFRYRTAA